MLVTRTATLRALRLFGIIAVIAVIAAYALWRSFDYARGPKIDIYEPIDGFLSASSTVTVRGRTERAVNLTLNGKTVSVDQEGDWNETLIVFPGVNVLSFVAADQFDRSISEELRVVGMEKTLED